MNIGEVNLADFFPCHDSYQLEDTMLGGDSNEFLFDVPLDCEEDAIGEEREVRVLGVTEEF